MCFESVIWKCLKCFCIDRNTYTMKYCQVFKQSFLPDCCLVIITCLIFVSPFIMTYHNIHITVCWGRFKQRVNERSSHICSFKIPRNYLIWECGRNQSTKKFLKSTFNSIIYRTLIVHIFWEGHKFYEISTLLLTYVVPVKSKVEIFVAFSEYMNFTCRQITVCPKDV